MSNKNYSPFRIDGQRFTSVTQYYNVEKARFFGDCDTVIAILQTQSARKCNELGDNIKNFDIAKWDAVAKDVMLKGVREKFRQNPRHREHLLSTGNTVLVECTKFDSYWASGMSLDLDHGAGWNGLNVLGEILGVVRNELK